MRTLLALTVLPWLTLSGTTVKNIAVPPETEVDFNCTVTALPVRWMWFPKHCKCAEESSMKVIYIIDKHGNKTSVQRFKKRLTLRGDPRAGNHALVLSDSVMSDSGTYTCADSKTIVQRYELEVTAGCYHNVQIEIRSGKEAEDVTLACSSCAGGKQIKNLKWTFNGKPVSDLHSIRQTRNLITIEKVTADEEGKWICASVDDPSQFSEYCLDLGSKIQHRRQDCSKDTTQATGLNKNDSETDGKGGLSDALKAVIVVALVLIVMVLLTSVWLYLYRRKRSRRLEQKLADNSAPNSDFSPQVSVGTDQAMTGTATQEEAEVQYASINLGQTKRQQRPLSVEESTVYSAVKIK